MGESPLPGDVTDQVTGSEHFNADFFTVTINPTNIGLAVGFLKPVSIGEDFSPCTDPTVNFFAGNFGVLSSAFIEDGFNSCE